MTAAGHRVPPPAAAPRLRMPRREWFLVTPLSALVNPLYIVRRGLLRGISELAPRIEGRVLDFGCGSRPYETLFTRASSYTGVDIQVSGHDHRDSKVDVFWDGSTLPFNDASFDAVVCFEVLEHVFDIDRVLSEIRRVLKPGATFMLSIPFAWDEHEAPYDFARYTSYGMRHVLERRGFAIEVLKKTNTYVLAVSQAFIAYLVQHALPRDRVFGPACQLLVVFPLTALSLVLDAILPRRDEYFSNLVVLCRKQPD